MSDLLENTSGDSPELKRTLGPVMLWGLGVGYVVAERRCTKRIEDVLGLKKPEPHEG